MGRIAVYPPAAVARATATARVRATSVRAATVDAWGATVFDVADEDNLGQWSAAQPTRLTCRLSGVYTVSGGLAYSHNAAGSRGIGFRKNSSGTAGPGNGTVLFDPNARGWSSTITTSITGVRLVVGDYMELCNLTGGVAVNVITEDGNPHLAWAYVGP